ncbi:hypothetical protein DET61_1333 [Marinobacter nauticus]|uniref:Uncharacterized protein n=1 Tax=Marinobacter nauticus TaxID=2743 RepID=A0A368UXM8_MARNT|nr:hypothetical protein [Marinobacter nauticus]RBP72406.1 hypothetical protein DET64_1074 [Marinobacter nauticus]RCW33333.1 hypothetical protein DET51_1074 [Marinobacter nauticus]RCW62108.1 hypothetical protein DET61_1333 [Marinobacter nauticus]
MTEHPKPRQNQPVLIRNLATAIEQSEIPLTVYGTIFATMALLWIFQAIHPDLTLGLFTELLGAAFTLFIIDSLLVRSKANRWKLVREHIDYLIARHINRLRDGVAGRAFGFDPDIIEGVEEAEQHGRIRSERARFLHELETRTGEELMGKLCDNSLFSESSYEYFQEKARDLWDILNMKYSEYMEPSLVSLLMRLHTDLSDVCGHIRQYRKADRHPEDAAFYHQIGRLGISHSLLTVIELVYELKHQGYSESAALT